MSHGPTELQQQIAHLNRELNDHRQALLASLLVSAWMVEARDPYTGGHLWRVAQFASALATLSGGEASESARIGIAGFLHDIGKIGIPDRILLKPGKLEKGDDPWADPAARDALAADVRAFAGAFPTFRY